MMRKLMVPVVAAVVLTMVVSAGAMAAGKPADAPYGTSQCTTWVDANGDGVCDNAGPLAPQDGTGSQYGASNTATTGAGQVTAPQTGLNNPATFVDADGDGQCDSVPLQDGTGNQVQRGGGRR